MSDQSKLDLGQKITTPQNRDAILYAGYLFFGRLKRGLKLLKLRVRVFQLRLGLKLFRVSHRLKLLYRRLKGRYLLFRLNRTLARLKLLHKKSDFRKSISNDSIATFRAVAKMPEPEGILTPHERVF